MDTVSESSAALAGSLSELELNLLSSAPSDGLTSADVEALVAEAEQVWARSIAPTTAFLDGTAALRRERREARRAIGAVVRSLPVRQVHTAPAGEVA